ncbi:MAG TPA: SOS response-associated peptidase [Candidatus Nanopelagicaceae bacterium]|nr:SOS response-associated peptidase [Candidatus Nanopelagicaceae bacterium]
MCGRYAASRRPEELIEEFELESMPDQLLAPNWNTAPTQSIYFVAEIAGKRTLTIARWGLIPSWSKDAKNATRTFNARIDSVDKPSFRSAFRSRRCIVPADGYYEWYKFSGGGIKNSMAKQPFYIHRADGGFLAMAGIYEYWRDPESGDLVTSAAIITREAVGPPAAVHDRMPVVLPSERYRAWLASDPSSPDSIPDLLGVDEIGVGLVCEPVSRLVNSARNNGPELTEPLPFEAERPLF